LPPLIKIQRCDLKGSRLCYDSPNLICKGISKCDLFLIVGYYAPSKTNIPTNVSIPKVISTTVPVEIQPKNNPISNMLIGVSFAAAFVAFLFLATVCFLCKKRNKSDGNTINIESLFAEDDVQNGNCGNVTPFQTVYDKTAGIADEDNETHKSNHVSTPNTVQPLRFNQVAERIKSWKPDFGVKSEYSLNNQKEMEKYYNTVSTFRYKTETLPDSINGQRQYYPAQDFDTDFYYSCNRNVITKDVPIKRELETIDGLYCLIVGYIVNFEEMKIEGGISEKK
jgi:hypothetical protein